MSHRWVVALCFVALAGKASAAPGDIETIAGGRVGDGEALATAVAPWGAVLGGTDLYFADGTYRVVRRMDLTTGQQVVVAGNGEWDYDLREGPATEIPISPSAVAFDLDGDLLIGDSRGYVLKLDSATGLIRSLAGGGIEDIRWNDDLSVAVLGGVTDLVVEPDGRLLVCNYEGFVYRLDVDAGTAEHVAGTGSTFHYGEIGDGGPATEADIWEPWDLGLDAAGNIFIADNMNRRVRRIDAATGIITTWVGGGHAEPADGLRADEVEITGVLAFDFDTNGDLVFGERYGRMWRVDAATRELTRVAGTGEEGPLGDGGPALDASVAGATALVVSPAGDIYTGSFVGHRIRFVEASTGLIDTIAGTGYRSYGGDGGPLSLAVFYEPRGVAFGDDGALYISDRRNHRVRRADPITGLIETVMGTGEARSGGHGTPPLATPVEEPYDVAAGPTGDLVVNAGRYGGRVLYLTTATGAVTPISYTSSSEGMTFDPQGYPVIASLWHRRVSHVDPTTGERTVLAGTGTYADPIDGELALASPFKEPIDVAYDSLGQLIILERGATVWRVEAGTERLRFVGAVPDGTRMALDAYDNVYVVRETKSDVMRIHAGTGEVERVAGIGHWSPAGFSGDGGPATEAQLRRPTDVAVGPEGHLYIADALNHRIRRVDLTAACGDGYVAGPERCDDGNTEAGDGCSPGCEVETHWTCTGPTSVCTLAPAEGCRVAERPSILVRSAPPGKEQLNFDWKRGEATAAADFGDPVSTTTSDLVVWDQDGARLRIRAIAPAGEGWRATKKGYRRRVSSGLRRVQLRSGEDGKSRIVVRGTGEGLGIPDTLDFEPPVVVQWLRRDDPDHCWTARFEDPIVSTPWLFRARE